MNKGFGLSKEAADKLIISIQHQTPKHYSAKEKIRLVLAALRGKESIAGLCRREDV